MKKVTIEVPESLGVTNTEVKLIFAAKLYEMGKVSQGQGAEIAGISKREFIETIGKYGVSIFNYSVEDLENELNNAALHSHL
jgi:predicted HTH domain antitoxin